VSKPEKLVVMSNQIAGFFASQKGDQAEAVAAHLVKFWTPAMCDTLAAHVRSGGAVVPLVRAAVERFPPKS
jgi:formate dehydrogenase subunit delta